MNVHIILNLDMILEGNEMSNVLLEVSNYS